VVKDFDPVTVRIFDEGDAFDFSCSQRPSVKSQGYVLQR
jgi:hypothetical protein